MRAHLEVAIPPGNHPESEPLLRPDVMFPNAGFSGYITGPVQIFDAMRFAMNPEGYEKSGWATWDQLEVHRNGEILGSLYDIRQAHHFAQNEFDFDCQLKFTAGRQRRVHKTQQAEGYQSIDSSGLYRKILKTDFHLHNHDLFLDLGDELNATLAACVVDPFMVVMCDLRMLNNDGITIPKGSNLETVYSQGPDAFPTLFTRNLASAQGWSKGHAHLGPIGLGKGHSTSQWSRGRGKGASASKKAGKVQDRDSWLDYSAVKKESTPNGCAWTIGEIISVKAFHDNYILRKIRHYPFPRTMSMRSAPAALSAHQFYAQAIPGVREASPSRTAPGMVVGYHRAHSPSAAAEEGLMKSSWTNSVSIPQSSGQSWGLPHNQVPVDQSVDAHQPLHAMVDYSPQSQYPRHDQFLLQSHMPVEQRALVHQQHEAMVDPYPQSQYVGDTGFLSQAYMPIDEGVIAHQASHALANDAPQPSVWTGSYHYQPNPHTAAFKKYYERNFHLFGRNPSHVSPDACSQISLPAPQLSHANLSLHTLGFEPVNVQYEDVTNTPQTDVQATSQSSSLRSDLGNLQDGVRVYKFGRPETPGLPKEKRPRRSFEEIGERPYRCGWRGCNKAYDTLGHLNDHVTAKSHGPRRSHGATSVGSAAEFAPVPSSASYKYKCGWNDCTKAYPELRHLNDHIKQNAHGPLRSSAEFPRAMDRDDPSSLYPEVPINESTSAYDPNDTGSFGMRTDFSQSQLLDPALFLPSSSLDPNEQISFGITKINENPQLGAQEPFLRSPYQGFGLDGCEDETAERRGSVDSGYCSQSPLSVPSSTAKNPETQISHLEKPDHRLSYIRDDGSPVANSFSGYPSMSAFSTRLGSMSSSHNPFPTRHLPGSHHSRSQFDLFLSSTYPRQTSFSGYGTGQPRGDSHS